MPGPARRLFAAIALALTLGAAAGIGLPGAAAAVSAAQLAGSDAPAAVAPEEGALVESGEVVLEWTPAEAPAGYGVIWRLAGDVLDAGSSTAFTTAATIHVDAGSYVWQVRVLPDGDWSPPATFRADLELPTLVLPEQADAGDAAPTATRHGIAAVPDSVWIVGALGFSAVFLAAVAVQSRVRREPDV